MQGRQNSTWKRKNNRRDSGAVENLIEIEAPPVSHYLDMLLRDKSTKRNIIWATDTYAGFGPGFLDTDEMKSVHLQRHVGLIRPRIEKSEEAQAARTRKKAEVFTPAWLCNAMNNHLDREWFGREGIFNTENENHTWTVTEEKIDLSPQKRRKVPLWQRYIDSRRLEITCGEAPYLVSRYDAATGGLILPLKRRIGLLDRKLRIVNENTETYADWAKWTLRAYESCYGYEYQGDSLLIARVNLLLTFLDYHRERWGEEPDAKLLQSIIERIVWNLWQMDGMKDAVPLGKPYAQAEEISLFDEPKSEEKKPAPVAVPCRVKDWRRQKSVCFRTLKEPLIK